MGSTNQDDGYSKHRVKSSERSLERKTRKPKELKSTTVQLVLLRSKKVNVIGAVTGKRYTFNGSGSIVSVDERDVPALLAKGMNEKSCCSGNPTSPYFQKVE